MKLIKVIKAAILVLFLTVSASQAVMAAEYKVKKEDVLIWQPAITACYKYGTFTVIKESMNEDSRTNSQKELRLRQVEDICNCRYDNAIQRYHTLPKKTQILITADMAYLEKNDGDGFKHPQSGVDIPFVEILDNITSPMSYQIFFNSLKETDKGGYCENAGTDLD